MSGKELCERIREGGSTAQKAYLWTPSIIFKYFSSDILFLRVSLNAKKISLISASLREDYEHILRCLFLLLFA